MASISDQMRCTPGRMTDLERHHDELLRFENRARYVTQSANTRDGGRADPPPRPPISPLAAVAAQR